MSEQTQEEFLTIEAQNYRNEIRNLNKQAMELKAENRALLADCRWAMETVLEANDGDHYITPDCDSERAQAWLDAHKERT
jgi:hypothetical protein